MFEDSAVDPSSRDSEQQAKNILDQITKLNSQIEKVWMSPSDNDYLWLKVYDGYFSEIGEIS